MASTVKTKFHRIASVEFVEKDAQPIPRVVNVKDVPYSFTLPEGQSFGPMADMHAARAARVALVELMPEMLGVDFIATCIRHSPAE